MEFPLINKQPIRTVNIPDLSGGVNQRDALYNINDNQLTDCLNVWFKDGILKTRPGSKNVGVIADGGEIIGNIKDMHIERKIDNDFCHLFFAYIKKTTFNENNQPISWYMQNAYFVSENNVYMIGGFSSSVGVGFCVQKGDILYAFTQDYKIYKKDLSIEQAFWHGDWEEIDPNDSNEDDIYIPTVKINCIPYARSIDENSVKSCVGYDGDGLEAYNLLTNYAKVIYTTHNPNMTSEEQETEASYLFPIAHTGMELKNNFLGKYVKAKITHPDKSYTIHKVVLDSTGNGREKTANEKDGLIMEASPTGIDFYVDEYNLKYFKKDEEFIRNNLEITFPTAGFTTKEKEKIFCMTQTQWFGGESQGINGGTRLFLGGNTKEKNLMIWSGLNNPLYFSENNYSYVGDSTEAICGFGLQDNALIIFKEREIWLTQYSQKSNISSENIINQSIVDYEASSVYFPLIQIHSNIGCDLPNTIQLCRNRLVWANTNGNIYTLVGQSQYSERNVYSISGMIKNKLSKETFIPEKTFAIDWNGCYILFNGRAAYVMDYNSYGYTHCYSYSKSEDAEKLIPFWYWEFPFEVRAAKSINDKGILFSDEDLYDKTFAGVKRFEIDFNCDTFMLDGEKKINTMLQTKYFDFGSPQYNKIIPILNIGVGADCEDDISVQYFTSQNDIEDKDFITVIKEDSKPYSPNYIKNVVLRPFKRFSAVFGIRLECNGGISIGKISMNYRLTGGNKNGIYR